MELDKVLIGRGTRPLVCTPLVGTSRVEIMSQLTQVLGKQPDIVEWRADFFEGIAATAEVIATAREIKDVVGGMPVIFTIRSGREGGQPISLTRRQAVELNAAVCVNTTVEYFDCELSNAPEDIRFLRKAATEKGKLIIGSFHDFEKTPSREILLAKFATAKEYDLDVAKVAVMPQSLEEVLALLSVTLEARRRFAMPLITMSMGRLGAITRMAGGLFGSSLTFAAGVESSAPGQLPVDDLKAVLDIIERAAGDDSTLG